MGQKSFPDWVGDCTLGMALRGSGPPLYLKPSKGHWWLAQGQDVVVLTSWTTPTCHPHPLSQLLECHVTQLFAAQMNQTSHNWRSGTQELGRVSRTLAG